jgi:hypothetical protein
MVAEILRGLGPFACHRTCSINIFKIRHIGVSFLRIDGLYVVNRTMEYEIEIAWIGKGGLSLTKHNPDERIGKALKAELRTLTDGD